jgi:hypothetical protein
MNLDAVETGLDRVRRAALETVDDLGDFLKRQRARLGDIGEGVLDEGLVRGANRRGRNRRAVVGLQRGM